MNTDNKETKEEVKDTTTPAGETVKGSDKESTGAEVKVEKSIDKETKETKEEKANTVSNETVEALRAELTAITEKAERIPSLEQELATAQATAEKQIKVITEYEGLVTKLVDTKMSQIPKDFADLVPSNLTLTQKLDWLDKAESKGLFKQEKKDKPNVEVGKPLNVEVPAVDSSKLSAGSLIQMAYNTVKGK